jgi:hypothetical protein
MSLIYNRKRVEVLLMQKMLKIMAMLLVIATVVFAAGCAGKTTEKTNVSAPGETEHVSTGGAPAENATDATANVTENVTANVTENVTGNVTPT